MTYDRTYTYSDEYVGGYTEQFWYYLSNDGGTTWQTLTFPAPEDPALDENTGGGWKGYFVPQYIIYSKSFSRWIAMGTKYVAYEADSVGLSYYDRRVVPYYLMTSDGITWEELDTTIFRTGDDYTTYSGLTPNLLDAGDGVLTVIPVYGDAYPMYTTDLVTWNRGTFDVSFTLSPDSND